MSLRKQDAVSILAMAFVVGPAVAVAARTADLAAWLEKDLTPYVAEQLTTHPRFKGELVRIVVFKDGNPAPTSDELALSLRDRLTDAVVDVPGVRVGWTHRSASNEAAAIDCSRDTVHYYVGLEVSKARNGQHRIELRALDLEDRSWVAGFGKSWQGRLRNAELRLANRPAADPMFRGQRAVPFAIDQPDLLAAHLAHELGCALLRQVSGEYVVALDGADAGSPGNEPIDPMRGVVELVSNNLAAYRALRVTQEKDGANSTLQGKAHPVDDELYQYWITVTPLAASAELPPVSASAYVQLAGHRAHRRVEVQQNGSLETSRSLVAKSDARVLSSVRIVELRSARACSSGNVSFRREIRRGARLEDWFDDCFALQVKTHRDAVVFFLNHQQNHGLVRLSGRDCSPRTDARIARANEPLDYALPLLSLQSNAASAASGWPLDPDADVYYAIAVSDSKAARTLSRQLDRLPRRCSISLHPGLAGSRLEDWLAGFSATVDELKPHVDWQAIRVRDVY